MLQLEQAADNYLASDDFLKPAFPLQFETDMHDSIQCRFSVLVTKLLKATSAEASGAVQ